MDFISILPIFVLACFVGYCLVWSVAPPPHTPLMAATNAISSVNIFGSLIGLAAGGLGAAAATSKWLGLTMVWAPPPAMADDQKRRIAPFKLGPAPAPQTPFQATAGNYIEFVSGPCAAYLSRPYLDARKSRDQAFQRSIAATRLASDFQAAQLEVGRKLASMNVLCVAPPSRAEAERLRRERRDFDAKADALFAGLVRQRDAFRRAGRG